MFDLDTLLRDNIRQLTPYASARDEFKGEAAVFLDANENSYGSPLFTAYNRYPDPHQQALKEKISRIKGLLPQHIFLGNGSDEAIDLLFRAFCRPGIDNVIVLPPTYGMYEVSAQIQDVEVRRVPLTTAFQPDIELLSETVDEKTKLIFLCSPNNPTGNAMDPEAVEMILNNFDGLLIVDEAYINYSRQHSFIRELTEYPNLVVLQTFSKAWGLAGLRLGMAFASAEIIEVLDRIKPPYNVNAATQQLVIEAIDQIEKVNAWIKQTVTGRTALERALPAFSFVKKVYPSDANFLLVLVDEPRKLYDFLASKGIVVRDRSSMHGCEGCLRITVGTEKENEMLLKALREYERPQ